MSPAKSIEEALQRLEEQEQTQLQETRQKKEELIQVTGLFSSFFFCLFCFCF